MILLISKLLFGVFLICSSCHSARGQQNASKGMAVEPFIVGGFPALPHEFPFVISLMHEGEHVCGGSILNKTTIITAAHCIFDQNPKRYSVMAGAHNLDNSSEPRRQVKKVKSLHVHIDYNVRSQLDSDIALVTLESPLEFNDWAKPIKMPAQNQDTEEPIWVIGWGLTQEGGDLSPELRKVKVPFVTHPKCKDIYEEQRTIITNNMRCWGNFNSGGYDACQGDSGGPGFLEGAPYLAGIVSFGIGCARPGLPGVYTDVSKFVHWIEFSTSKDWMYSSSSINQSSLAFIALTGILITLFNFNF